MTIRSHSILYKVIYSLLASPVFFNLFPITVHFLYLKNLAEHQEKIEHILSYLLIFSYFSVMFGPALRSINLEFG